MMKLVVDARFLWAVLLAAALPAARGVWLNMPSSGLKCVFEELQSNVVVMGDYYSFYGYGDGDVNDTVNPTLTVEVSSPSGSSLYKKGGGWHGKFAFTTKEPGKYVACFEVENREESGKTVRVGLEWEIGIATKDWESVAKKENIEGLDLELEKLQNYVKAISEKMLDLMKRELKMKALNRETNARVAKYSQASLGVCILVSALQLCYLRRYFINKKLI